MLFLPVQVTGFLTNKQLELEEKKDVLHTMHYLFFFSLRENWEPLDKLGPGGSNICFICPMLNSALLTRSISSKCRNLSFPEHRIASHQPKLHRFLLQHSAKKKVQQGEFSKTMQWASCSFNQGLLGGRIKFCNLKCYRTLERKKAWLELLERWDAQNRQRLRCMRQKTVTLTSPEIMANKMFRRARGPNSYLLKLRKKKCLTMMFLQLLCKPKIWVPKIAKKTQRRSQAVLQQLLNNRSMKSIWLLSSLSQDVSFRPIAASK